MGSVDYGRSSTSSFRRFVGLAPRSVLDEQTPRISSFPRWVLEVCDARYGELNLTLRPGLPASSHRRRLRPETALAMMETVEGTDIDPEEFNVPGQWYVSKQKGKAAPLENNEARQIERHAEREAERHIERQRAADKRAGRKIAAKSVERQTARIPDGAEKIIMRPRGGLVHAAGEDVFSMNSKQQTILVATINAERKRKYAELKLFMFEGEKIEVTTYVAMPEDCGKAVVHEVPLTYSDADILQRLRTYGNPPVLGVPRWVRLTPMAQRCVIYRKKYEVCIACGRLGHRDDVSPDPAKVKCHGCGMEQPPQGHSCEPKCQLCGKGHPLGDRKCRELYRVPYEVKKKQWEHKTNMRQQQQLQKQQPAGETAEGTPRGRSKERRDHEDFCATTDSFPRLEETTEQQHGHSSSRTRGRSGSRPRERSSSRDQAQPWPRKRSQSKDQNSVSFGSGVSLVNDKQAEEIDKLRKEVGALKEVIEKLTQEFHRSKLQARTGSPYPQKLQPKLVSKPIHPAPAAAHPTQPAAPKEEKMIVESARPPPLKRKGEDVDPSNMARGAPSESLIWQWNCRAFQRKRALVQQHLTLLDEKPLAIALQESGKAAKLSGYQAFSSDKGDKSRVTTLIRRNIAAIEHEVNSREIEAVLLEILTGLKDELSVFLLNLYSTPRQRKVRFRALFRKAIEAAGTNPLLIVGDFNAAHPEWGYAKQDPKGRQLWENAHEVGLILHTGPSSPSRVDNSVCADTSPDLTFSKNVTDLKWTNSECNFSSDHFMLALILKKGVKTRRARQLRITDWELFRDKRDQSPTDKIENIEKWTKTLACHVEEATKTLDGDDAPKIADSKLLHSHVGGETLYGAQITGAREHDITLWTNQGSDASVEERLQVAADIVVNYAASLCAEDGE
ncbi:hypothetical protein HPB52_025086 [Rhipicephalus sanguineus]|uniref:Endonuclease/exonuclease/phosphatase domain-containing protein n=1 Tax=Rhipicephalus sanguineus TaxID=34632 RepID=A0A9D4P8T9_RHISA|nr:hypothetical protein HPB52_025086 [Rhipicephalus sanguineus]